MEVASYVHIVTDFSNSGVVCLLSVCSSAKPRQRRPYARTCELSHFPTNPFCQITTTTASVNSSLWSWPRAYTENCRALKYKASVPSRPCICEMSESRHGQEGVAPGFYLTHKVKQDLSFVLPGLFLTSSKQPGAGFPATSFSPYLSGCRKSMS